LGNAADRSVAIEKDRAGTGRALIQCQDERHKPNRRCPDPIVGGLGARRNRICA
jgi:hypothetical protein